MRYTVRQLLGTTTTQRYFALVFAAGILAKYNYALLRIYAVPTVSAVVLKNVVLLIVFAVVLFPLVHKKRGRAFLLLLLSGFTLFFVANMYYHRYFGNYLSYTDILVGQGAWSFKVLARQLLAVTDLLCVADLAALLYLNAKANKSGAAAERSQRHLLLRSPRPALFALGAAAFMLAAQLLFTNALLGNDPPGALYKRNSGGYVGVYGIVPLYLHEINAAHFSAGPAPGRGNYPPKPDVQIQGSQAVDTQPNIVAIQVESLDAKLLGFSHNGTKVTPFLNRLKEESLYAENMYAQHVNGSFDAELSFLTSLYPVSKNYAFESNDMTAFDSLVRILNDNGYETMAFHANDAAFFGREKAYPALGFDSFHSRSDYSAQAGVIGTEDPYFGINDYDFFRQSLDYIDEAPEPFFAFMITVTSHTPFDYYPPAEARDAFQDISPTIVRDYFNSMSFVDKSLEMLFSGLRQRGLADNTVFLLYADHAAVVSSEVYSSGGEFVAERELKYPEHIPLIINYPEVTPETIRKSASTVDLAPTLLDLIGAEPLPAEFSGSSLLRGEEQPVLFLHESPQALYKGNLFVLEPAAPPKREELVRIGRVKQPRATGVALSAEQERDILDTITDTREMMSIR